MICCPRSPLSALVCGVVVVLCAFAPDASALTIVADYSADSATDNFFASRPLAKAAVDAAAASLSSFITSTFSAISSTGTPNATNITGTMGSTTATAEWGYSYYNPSTNAVTDITAPSVAANTIRIFVGMRELTASTISVGGTAGAFLTTSASGFETELASAVSLMAASSNAYMRRGSSLVVDTFTDSITMDSTTAGYSLSYAPAYGTLTFDIDTNNDGFTDLPAQMDAFWHFDATKPVPAGKMDFYSVALHEMVHAIGLGSSATWDAKHSGTTWLGAKAIALNGGTGAGLISADGSHISQSIVSTSLVDGVTQTPLLAPSQAAGTRRQLTAMDAAILQDLGYIVIVPEPGSAILVAVSGLFLLFRRRRFGRT